MHDLFARFWGRLLIALAATWLLFVLANLLIDAFWLRHLRMFRHYTVADHVRLDRIAAGSNQLARGRALEKPMMVVFPGPLTEASNVDLNKLRDFENLISQERTNRTMDVPPLSASKDKSKSEVPPKIEPLHLQHLRLLLWGLKYRAMTNTRVPGDLLPLFDVKLGEASREQCDQAQKWAENLRLNVQNLTDPQLTQYHQDLGRLDYFGTNLPVLTGVNTAISNEFTLLVEARNNQGWLAVAIEPRSDWKSRTWVARVAIIFQERKMPNPVVFQSSQRPVITLIRRGGAWWTGLRPIAVLRTERNLAEEFQSLAESIRNGTGLKDELRPKQDQRERVTQWVRQALLEQLGHDSMTDDKRTLHPYDWIDAAVYDRPIASCAQWIEWPRRLNGGNWWGIVQFLIFLTLVLFAIEFAYVWRYLTQTVPSRNSLTPIAIVAETDRQASATYRLWYLNAALPLLGFFGTIVGLSVSLIGAGGVSSEDAVVRQDSLNAMLVILGTAFDKSFFAFIGCILTTFGCYRIQEHGRELLRKDQPRV